VHDSLAYFLGVFVHYAKNILYTRFVISLRAIT